MLKKIITVKNVGRLKSCSAPKGEEFKHVTLLFAENGRGKSTLAAIFRSLATNDPNPILERATLDVGGAPEATIRIGTSNHSFNNSTWNAPCPDIEVFDTRFVTENVYNGELVDLANRRNLNGVIVGATGVALSKEVSRLDGEIRELNKTIDLKKKTVDTIAKSLKTDDFLALTEIPDVDVSIEATTQSLKAAEQIDVIKAGQTLTSLDMPVLPAKMADVLSQTIEGISSAAEARIRAHMAAHQMDGESEHWVADGMPFLVGDTCPFCGQDVKVNDLISAFKGYFSESYGLLRADVEQCEEDINDGFGVTTLTSLRQQVQRNEATGAFWKAYLKSDPPALDLDGDILPALKEMGIQASRIIGAKKSSPLSAVKQDAPYADAVQALSSVAEKVASYNKAVLAFNEKIADKKAATLASDSKTLAAQLERLKITKERFTATTKVVCADYTQGVDKKKQLDQAKEKAKGALDTHAASVFGKYEHSINDLLDGFNAGFRIGRVQQNYSGGVPGSSFEIVINKKAVALGDVKTVGKPSFRSTLSSGDRSTLALAFFLAKLFADPERAKKIVLFDDPFNSQDRSRRNRTKELLSRCAAECAQVLVLSHDPFFLKLLHDAEQSKGNGAHLRMIQLSRVLEDNSTLEEWDLEKETTEGYFLEHAALVAYIDGDSKLPKLELIRKLRPFLEMFCRYRFPNRFKETEWMGDMIGIIRDTGQSDPMFPMHQELSDINDYCKRYHHETNTKADSEPIDDTELAGYTKRTLKVVGGY